MATSYPAFRVVRSRNFADEERWNIVRWGHVLDRLGQILGRRVDFAARRSLPEDVHRRADAEAVAMFA